MQEITPPELPVAVRTLENGGYPFKQTKHPKLGGASDGVSLRDGEAAAT